MDVSGLERVGAMLDRLVSAQPPELESPPQRLTTTLFMPGLPSRPWFDPGEFEWMERVVALGAAVRADLGGLSDVSACFLSYVGEDRGVPESIARGWRSFFLCRDGHWHPSAARLCPATLVLVDGLPWFPGDIMFSVLGPGVEIPPHYGLDNLHLTLHLPLIVPAGCGIEVNGVHRTPVVDEPLVFDDTFRHSAWNRGEEDRTHLVVDVWHPGLTSAERTALRLAFTAVRRWNRIGA